MKLVLGQHKLHSIHYSYPNLKTMKFSPHLLTTTFVTFSILVRISFILAATAATTTVVASTQSLDLTSLLSIKSSLIDPLNTFHDWNLTNANNFSKPRNFQPVWCSWSGIKCDVKNKSVTVLDLSTRNLSGSIPSEIKHLSNLEYLNLSRNTLSEVLQSAIFELPNLKTLDISHNMFNSSFPNGISKLKFLTLFSAYSNSFTGPLPEEVFRLPNLELLNLGGSYFNGTIPVSYGKFLKLKSLYLNGNLLTGKIPAELGFLSEIEHMELGYNAYSGGLPVELSQLSNLIYLDISSANLSGELPVKLGNLKKLKALLLFKNQFTGNIPGSLVQLKDLESLDLSVNNLTGNIPVGFSALKELKTLSLMNNTLTGEIPEEIGDLPNLESLSLWNNLLSGILPQNLGSNGNLKFVDVSSNSLSGPIPSNLCLSKKLVKLILFSNQFTGEIPPSLANCTTLSRIRIQDNNLNGSIPFGFGLFPNLTFVDISDNNFSGPIPKDLGNAARLQFLNISENSFNSVLPDNIWSAPTLQVFIASFANLNGKIPDFVECQNFYRIELDGNNLTGRIPSNIDHCGKLIRLNLRRNSLTGLIPSEISTLPSITDIDLSYNFLTGVIPSDFQNCRTLEDFNVSYNQLTGPIPSSGPVFSTLHPSSFTGNEGLCGGALKKPCRTDELAAGGSVAAVRPPEKKTAGAILWIVVAAFGIGLFVLIIGTRCFRAKYGDRAEDKDFGPWKLTAFQRLNFTVDNVLECQNTTDKILGMGSTGTVYKAEMPGGEIVAVKKLWGKQKETIRKRSGVLAEVEVLGNVRHRNIVRLLGCCSNNRCTMLLYEYMPNGSLDDLLHGKNKGCDRNLTGDWLIRYKIAVGVAQGISYLHHDCDPVIVHRDLKPSNILLDGDMEARVADFGVAKLMQTDELMSVIAGSYGYIAPEYAYTLQVDEKSDIYSYGVILMEIVTGKRSIQAEFGDGNSIVDWVKSKIKTKDGIDYVLDKNVGASCTSIREEMLLLLRVALLCTSRNPTDRPSMRDVLSMLQVAKPKRKLAEDGIDCGDDIVIDVKNFS